MKNYRRFVILVLGCGLLLIGCRPTEPGVGTIETPPAVGAVRSDVHEQSPPAAALPAADNPAPPGAPVKLIFIHHSTGENWLADWDGGLGSALRDDNYFVSDTNYGWGPDGIGDTTDIGHWWTWFRGPASATYLSALYAESGQHAEYARLADDPGGENAIILFKACFPNSNLAGNPADPPTIDPNPLRGQDSSSEHHTIGNAKGIYNDLLTYFAAHQDKLFVAVTAPPLVANGTDPAAAANARAFNDWLVNDWLDGYPYANVAVFDFFDVLTSNAGSVDSNDLGQAAGNHHRWWDGAVQHSQTVNSNVSAYGSDAWDSHPTAAGNQKATGELVPLLNVFYHRWRGDAPAATATPTPTSTSTTATATPTATAVAVGGSAQRLQPADLIYLGAFRLPDVPGDDEHSWKWANRASALTCFPEGDPAGPSDGYPGSLFGTGHDWHQWVSEVTIPAPVDSPIKDLADLNSATTLQDFADIRGGLFGEMEMPRVGLAYLPPMGAQTSGDAPPGRLYFAWAPHLDGGATAPSHGWSELDLAYPQSAGAWRISDYWNYVTGDYLFDIPQTWADTYVAGRSLATGRYRDGGQGAEGPALFAIAPWVEGNPPAADATLPATPLLLYSAVTDAEQHPLDDYHHSDEWTGAAWLTAGDKSAVVFVGAKGTGDCWYGCADGTRWEPPYPPECPDGSERGWWSSGFVGQMLFYDPADLAAVAQGTMASWQPQPYATLDLDDHLYHVTSAQQKYHLAAAAFDRARGLLYVLEPLADDDKPLVHVWRIAAAPVAIIAALDADAVRLSWTHDPIHVSYKVWREPTPYFEPTAPELAQVTSPPWQYDDRHVRGDPDVNLYYLVGGVRADAAIDLSNRVGEFDFALTGASPPSGTTCYVRTDGGSAEQCTGLANAAYSGSGLAQPCAWDHPFRALPPDGSPRIAGGDTLIIGPGSYRMGYGAPGADACEMDYPWGCHMPPIPSGPDPAHLTRILGAGWRAGCADPPELWGTERADVILNLAGSSNVEVACLEITDHAACVEFHTGGLACERDTYPFGDWAAAGLYAEDSANVHLQDLNIHGLASAGVHAGRLTDWSVEDVQVVGNGWVGWDGDIDGDDSNAGTLTFRRWTVAWNGCGETYPGGEPTGCWAQSAGGYGDGVGTGATGGDWIIEDSEFLHNTSDGLDLLYHTLGGAITLNRVRAEGNAGNQVKVTGQTAITSSVLVGDCAYFDGQPFTYNVDPCRALGNTLEVVYTGGEHVSIVNTTFYGQGDGLVGAGPREGYSCNGAETLTGRNNVFLGDQDYFDPGDVTFLFYQEGCGGLTFQGDYGIAFDVKNTAAPWVSPAYPSAHNLLADPQLAGPFAGDSYGMELTASSPAIDVGDPAACPAQDIRGVPRPVDGDGDGVAVCDMGAYEWWSPTVWAYLSVVMRGY